MYALDVSVHLVSHAVLSTHTTSHVNKSLPSHQRSCPMTLSAAHGCWAARSWCVNMIQPANLEYLTRGFRSCHNHHPAEKCLQCLQIQSSRGWLGGPFTRGWGSGGILNRALSGPCNVLCVLSFPLLPPQRACLTPHYRLAFTVKFQNTAPAVPPGSTTTTSLPSSSSSHKAGAAVAGPAVASLAKWGLLGSILAPCAGAYIALLI